MLTGLSAGLSRLPSLVFPRLFDLRLCSSLAVSRAFFSGARALPGWGRLWEGLCLLGAALGQHRLHVRQALFRGG